MFFKGKIPIIILQTPWCVPCDLNDLLVASDLTLHSGAKGSMHGTAGRNAENGLTVLTIMIINLITLYVC